MSIKLTETEYKIMEVLWKKGDMTASELVGVFKELLGWNKNTTYTMIKKCVEKGAIERKEPGFVCHPLVSRQQAQQTEVARLLDRFFDGSADKLFASLLGSKKLPADELEKLKAMVDQATGGE